MALRIYTLYYIHYIIYFEIFYLQLGRQTVSYEAHKTTSRNHFCFLQWECECGIVLLLILVHVIY